MMKKWLMAGAVFSLILFTGASQRVESELEWHDWNTGFELAKSEKKIALIDVYTEWCGWCKHMDKTTYNSTEVVSLIQDKFVPIKFNPELKKEYYINGDTLSGKELLGALSQGRHSGFPTTYFFLPKKQVMFQYPGYMDEKKFLNLLNDMIDKSNT